MESILKHSLCGDIPYLSIRTIKKEAKKTMTIMYGKIAMTVTKTATDLKVVKRAIWDIIGRIKSSVATSFENLVKILPIGLESKNSILDLHSVVTIFLCMNVVLVCRVMKMTTDLEKVQMT